MRQLLHKLLMPTRALALVAIIVSVCQQARAQVDPNLSFSAAEATATIDGNGVNLIAPSLSNPLGVAVTYSSSNEAVASVNVSGNVTVIAPGQTTISARATDENTYLQTPASYLLTVKRDITGATVTLAETSFTYDGTAKTPAVSSVTLGGQALDAAYYSVSYSNNVDAAAADVAAAPTVTVTGSFIYFGSVSTTFSISKGAAGLAYSTDAESMTLGEDWTQPTLTNPHQLSVTYGSSDTGVATVSATGAVTAQAAGTTTISAAFAGNENYEAQTVSYSLTVKQPESPENNDPPKPIIKGPADLQFSATETEGMIGDPFTPPTLSNPHGLSVTFSSSDPDVADIDGQGRVSLLNFGNTTISASFAGNDYYEAQTVSYQLTVRLGFELWVGGTRVSTGNFDNVLGDNRFFYDVDRQMLIVTGNHNPLTIESGIGDLTIFLNGESRLERIVSLRSGKLRLTTYADIPGKLLLATNYADGVISGFSSVEPDSETLTFLLDPEGGSYQNGRLLTAGGSVAKKATVGPYLMPLSKATEITFPPEKYEGANLTNTVIDNLLFKLVQHAGDSEEDDDYYDPVEQCIVLNNIGSSITFMVPSGEGEVELDVQTDPGYRLTFQIGDKVPQEVVMTSRGGVTFDYQVEKPSYAKICLEGKSSGTRIGKRDKHHGSVYRFRLDPLKVYKENPLLLIPGYPNWLISKVEPGEELTAIRAVELSKNTAAEGADEGWYDLQGRRIVKPVRPGIYIHHGKKWVVR